MTYFTTSLAVVAGACWAVAALFAFQGTRRVRSRTVDLLFAAFATSYGAAVLSARAVYVSSTAAEAQAFDRLTALFAAVGFALLLLFAAAYTEAPRRTATAARLLSVLFFALAAVAVARHLGMKQGEIRDALAQFGGVNRRFTRVGEVNGVTIITHGSAPSKAIKGSIDVAAQAVRNNMVHHMTAALAKENGN